MVDPADPWPLERDLIFLNHGSFGSCPRPVQAVQARLREELEAQPIRFLIGELEDRLDGVRAALGAVLGADAQDLAFVANATTGVNAVLRSLELGSGDELLTTSHEYNACKNALDYVAGRAGARVVVADLPFPIADPAQATAAVLAAVTPRTRLALIDHVTSPTALVLPIADIGAGLAARGVELLVDAAHAPGMVPLDLRALSAAGVTYYTGNLHKWVCAPKGCAVLWVRRDRQPQVRPTVISHGANSGRCDRSRFLLEFDWAGTIDPTGLLAVPAALEFLAGLEPGGLPALQQRNRALALRGRDLLCAALGVAPPAPDSMIGSMASIPLPDMSAELARSWYGPNAPPQDALLERHRIQTVLPIWPRSPHRLVRISAQHYNRDQHYRALAAALVAELEAERRT
jgi:isopenicillin-N epimerase